MNRKTPASRKPSAQLRLTPKAGMNKPTFNPPGDVKCRDLLSPPYTPRNEGGNYLQTDIKADSPVDELVTLMKRGKSLRSESLKITTGINHQRSVEKITDSSLMGDSGKKERNTNEVIFKSEASKETIKITANLGDGKRKVMIKNLPKWNGKQVYDPFASYHETLDKPYHNVGATGKPKKSSVHFGPSTLICSSNSKPQIENGDDSIKNIQEDEKFKALEEVQKSDEPISPPLTPRVNGYDSNWSSKYTGRPKAATLRRPKSNDCICLRSLKLVLCTHCEYTFYGRLRKICKSHPDDIYELDIDACPKCNEKNMDCLKECDLPEEMGNISNKLITK